MPVDWKLKSWHTQNKSLIPWINAEKVVKYNNVLIFYAVAKRLAAGKGFQITKWQAVW